MIRSKKNQRRAINRSENHVWMGTAMTVCLVGLMVGCGGGGNEGGVVPPPSPTASDSDSSLADDSPGEMVLPPGEIPPAQETTGTSEESGIQMPKDVAVPSEDDGAALPDVEFESWEEIVKLAKSTGRVTVVDLWSLACEPCLKEFPGLVKLHQEHGDSVQCIAVDLDFDGRKSRPPEHYQDDVLEFLKSVGAAGFPMYISNTPSDEVFTTADLVSIPAVLIFDADGAIAMKFVDAGETAGFTYEKDVIPFIEKLAG